MLFFDCCSLVKSGYFRDRETYFKCFIGYIITDNSALFRSRTTLTEIFAKPLAFRSCVVVRY